MRPNDDEVAESLYCNNEVHLFLANMNIFKDLLKNKNEIPLLIIRNMKSSWKINQFINHINNIKHKILVYVGDEFIKFSQWKCDLITSTIKYIYKSGKHVDKNEVINGIYNLVKLSDEEWL